MLLQQQPGMFHGAADLRQLREGVQRLFGADSFGLRLRRQCVDSIDLVRLGSSRVSGRLVGQDEGAEVSVKQVHPLDRLGPQIQITLLKQEVLFILVTKLGSLKVIDLKKYTLTCMCGDLRVTEQVVNNDS